MELRRRPDDALTVAIVGLVALASAMGIGRFAFTPMLPLMQQHDGLTLVQGGWLASTNYAGYLVGALWLTIANPPAAATARAGLAAIAVVTAAMATTQSYIAWLVLRFLAGIASACVLVGISGWALPRFAGGHAARASGIVFAGVGIGIALAGAVALAAGVLDVAPASAWLVLGAFAGATVIFAWGSLAPDSPPSMATTSPPVRWRGNGVRLVVCYGAFGFGYIIPATFVPALARDAVADPRVFGWAWPLFGVAAAVSTIAAARWLGRMPPAVVWATGHLVMAAGVIAPAVLDGIAPILASALLVGGTFMVVTMAGIQHARLVSGAQAHRLVAAMTAAFAFGQLVGPLLLRSGASGNAAIVGPSAIAGFALVASALALLGHSATPAASSATKGN